METNLQKYFHNSSFNHLTNARAMQRAKRSAKGSIIKEDDNSIIEKNNNEEDFNNVDNIIEQNIEQHIQESIIHEKIEHFSVTLTSDQRFFLDFFT